MVKLLLLLLLSRFKSFPTLYDPIDSSPPGSSVPGILQARILEWVAISFSNACMHAKALQSYPTVRPHEQQPTRLKASTCNAGASGSIPGVKKIPWRRAWQPTPVLLPGRSHVQSNLVDYSPWCHKRVGQDLVTKNNKNKSLH